MKITTLDELLEDELKDIYSAENQIIKALPKMAEATESRDLRTAFEKHLEQTRVHVQRIEEICNDLKITPLGKNCKGMEGTIKEGEEVLQSDMEAEPKYGTARAHARQLCYLKAVDLLGQTLDEEKETDQKLTKLAENRVNVKAAMSSDNADFTNK